MVTFGVRHRAPRLTPCRRGPFIIQKKLKKVKKGLDIMPKSVVAYSIIKKEFYL